MTAGRRFRVSTARSLALVFFAAGSLASHVSFAGNDSASVPQVIDLWPEGVPGLQADGPAEHTEDGRVYNISNPTLTVFASPPEGRPAPPSGRTAVIVCPGGGYVRLAINKEGSDVTRWMNELGVAAFVLKYRTAPHGHPAPLRDVLRAVRWVRANAKRLGIDPNRVGLFGSSAGGHLAASAGALFDAPEGRVAAPGNPEATGKTGESKSGAALDKISARPDFLILTYPVVTMTHPFAHAGSRKALLGEHPSAADIERMSIERHVTRAMPPTFLVHTTEDKSVPIENSLMLYQALRAADVPVEMHLYEKGPHGFGMAKGLGPTSEWPKRCEEWMRSHGWLPTESAAAPAVPAALAPTPKTGSSEGPATR